MMRFVNYTGTTIICSSTSNNLEEDKIKFSLSMRLQYPFICFSTMGLGEFCEVVPMLLCRREEKNVFQDSRLED